MKRTLLTALAVTVTTFSIPMSALAQDAVPAPAATKDESQIIPSMERMASAFRRVRRMAANPASNEQSLASLEIIRTEALASKKFMPMMAADKPEADRPKFMADYVTRMDEFVAIVDQAVAAIKAGDNATASTLVNGLTDFQEKAHADFQKQEKK